METTKVEQYKFELDTALAAKDKAKLIQQFDKVIDDVLKNDLQVTLWASSLDTFSGLKVRISETFDIDQKSMRVAARVPMQKQRAALFMKVLKAAIQRSQQPPRY